MRRSVFYTMSQAERRGRLKVSSWPNLDWENEWVMLTTFDEFDRSIAMDARSGKLQEALEIPYNGPYDVEEIERRHKNGNTAKLPTKDQIEKWSETF